MTVADVKKCIKRLSISNVDISHTQMGLLYARSMFNVELLFLFM